jgi:hypothetical protein
MANIIAALALARAPHDHDQLQAPQAQCSTSTSAPHDHDQPFKRELEESGGSADRVMPERNPYQGELNLHYLRKQRENSCRVRKQKENFNEDVCILHWLYVAHTGNLMCASRL